MAVVYHAEAEWGSASEPFEKSVKGLAQHQNPFDRYFVQDPTGLMGPVQLKRAN